MRDTIDMAREAGFEAGKVFVDGVLTDAATMELKVFEALVRADQREVDATVCKELERFAALVAAAEREACAKVCDDLHPDWKWRAAESIRARGNT